MGFRNVGRLKNGIVAYQKWMRQIEETTPSCFEGENFVFDRRRLAD